MRASEDRSSASWPHASAIANDAGISAPELARMARVTAADIHYWGKEGYLAKRAGSSPFPLSQLPKAQLMGILVRQLHMDAANASRLAQQLLPVYEKRPDVIGALEALADAVESRIDDLAQLLMETDLLPQLAKLKKPRRGKEEKTL